jgi:hypothetical protein
MTTTDLTIVYARCLVCGYESSDPSTLETWNGYSDHIGPWTPACIDHSIWVRSDGSVIVVNGDERHEIDAPTKPGLPRGVFDMDALAEMVSARGVCAFTGHSGGGCATLYTGSANPEGYRVVAAGPGTYKHRDWGFSVGSFADFYVGDDMDDGAYETVTEMSMDALADLIVARHIAILTARTTKES